MNILQQRVRSFEIKSENQTELMLCSSSQLNIVSAQNKVQN